MKSKAKNYFSAFIVLAMLSIVLLEFGVFEKKEGSYFGGEIGEFCVNENCYKKDDQNLYQEIIQATMEKWKNIKLVDMISTNKNKFQEMGFVEPKIILKINGKSLEIGAISSDYTGTFVKRENEDKIYKINVIMDKNNIANPQYWAKREIPVVDSKK